MVTVRTSQCRSPCRAGDLKILARKSLRKGFLRLVTAAGHVVTPAESLADAGIQDGDHLTVVPQEAQLAATEGAFALWCCGGDRVITWGDAIDGGDSSAVTDQLRNVQQIEAGGSAFAAILADGSVVTWGNPRGGDSSAVQDQMKSVQQVKGTRHGAFAAILADGSVVTWGDP